MSKIRVFEVHILVDEADVVAATHDMIERALISGVSELVHKGEVKTFSGAVGDMVREVPADFGKMISFHLTTDQKADEKVIIYGWRRDCDNAMTTR